LITEYELDAVAIRCWNELELTYGVAPCLVLCELNERGIQAACEVDIPNALTMRALSFASAKAPMLLDINNNYGYDDTKSILFHCGPVPISLLEGKGKTIEHKMFAKSYGEGSGVGVNEGRITKNKQVTFGSAKTEKGKIHLFLGEGRLTDDPIEEEFFGTGVVLETSRMQEILQYVGTQGYRHHLSLVHGSVSIVVQEALANYLDYEIHYFKP
jgi:L-fucose isomerase-like protein